MVRTLDRRELESLPTSARNFTQLLVIEPGVSADISELLSNDNASISPSVNGARTTNNSFVFNGVDVTSLLCCNSRVNGRARNDRRRRRHAVAQHRAGAGDARGGQAADELYDAATGATAAETSSSSRRAAPTRCRGTAYHYFQNDELIANDSSSTGPALETRAPAERGGGTIGGPIIKNRTFFFGSYQRTRARDVVRGRGEQYRAHAERPHRRPLRRRNRPVRRRQSGTRRAGR